MKNKKIKYFLTRNYKTLKLNIECWFNYNIFTKFYRYITYTFWERLARSIAFFKLGWLNYDFDSHYIHELILFKLKRLYHCFVKYGHHSTDCPNYKPKMKSLSLVIKLLERYCSDNSYDYYSKPIDRHDKKWGKLNSKSIPYQQDEDGYIRSYSYITYRDNVLTSEDKEQEKKEFLEAYHRTEERQERDVRLALSIIAKYHRHWWD